MEPSSPFLKILPYEVARGWVEGLVGGPSKVFAKLCGMGPHGERWGIGWVLPCRKAWWQRMVIELGLSSGYLMAGLLFPAKFIAERIFG